LVTTEGSTKIWKINSYTDLTLPGPLLSFACGTTHQVALTQDHKIYVWGQNYYSQLGINEEEEKDCEIILEPTLLEIPKCQEKIISVHARAFSNYAITESGVLWVWGANHKGELGLPESIVRAPKSGPSFPSPIVDFAPGFHHAIALTQDGTVWTWGFKRHGCLGVPSDQASSRPIRIAIPNVERVYAGTAISLALTKKGALYVWGWNKYSQLPHSELECYEPHLIFLKGVQDVACGTTHTLALLEDGSLWGWGQNREGQLLPENHADEICLPTQIELPRDAGRIRGLIATKKFSGIITEFGDLFVLGGRKLHYVPELKLHVPNQWKELWRKIFRWLFIGKNCENSVIYLLPVEIIFHFVILFNH
jgi:alpha-tubulin suppressor-like RCC1 family protein